MSDASEVPTIPCLKIVCGANPLTDFKVYAPDGTDLTDALNVKSCGITIHPNGHTLARLECYAEVEVAAHEAVIETTDPAHGVDETPEEDAPA